MSENRVNLTIEQGIAHVSFNRPDKHNALNMDMFLAIDDVIKRLKKQRDVRVVIVSGEGPSFCSGLDVKSVIAKPSNSIKLLFKWLPGNANLAQRVSIGWRRMGVPVIMAIHGKCWGGGMQIALGGDFRIASKDASLSIMESRWGLIPDMGGTPALEECVAGDMAIRLAMTSETIDAETAQSVGLITEVADNPMSAAKALAQKLIARSPDTNKTIKKMYHKIWCRKERSILAKESLNQVRIILGKNQRIAVKREMGDTSVDYKL